jgi:hypothetical protein
MFCCVVALQVAVGQQGCCTRATLVYRLIKEYEREARVDGKPTEEIQAAKQRYVSQVNSYVARKKEAAAELKASTPQAYPSTSGQDHGQPQQQMQGVPHPLQLCTIQEVGSL